MPQDRIYQDVDLTYSHWHRARQIERYVAPHIAERLLMIDIDSVEACDVCRAPLALIETAQDVGQTFKATTITRKLAKLADVPAYLVFYTIDDDGDISRFRVKRLYPHHPLEYTATPDAYARWLVRLRERHPCWEGVEIAA